jgi:hypothetical protein
MANERLRAAMGRRRASIEAVATAAEVDPKTVGRWLGGRKPHPRHRWAVAKFLNEDEEFLWPGARRRSADPDSASAEIVTTYPYRSDMPTSTWWNLITRAQRQIDLLGYTLYFLPMQHPQLIETLKTKCEEGCKIRAVIADPDSKYVADRDAEEDLALTLMVRIRTSLKYFKPLLTCQGFELRYQDVPLYNSIFRFDDEMFVTPHLYATPGSSAPLLHLRRLGPNGLFYRFETHFNSIWAATSPVSKDHPKKAQRGGPGLDGGEHGQD